jgi:hypothetical protein
MALRKTGCYGSWDLMGWSGPAIARIKVPLKQARNLEAKGFWAERAWSKRLKVASKWIWRPQVLISCCPLLSLETLTLLGQEFTVRPGSLVTEGTHPHLCSSRMWEEPSSILCGRKASLREHPTEESMTWSAQGQIPLKNLVVIWTSPLPGSSPYMNKKV